MTACDPIQPVADFHHQLDQRLEKLRLHSIGYAAFLLVATPSYGEAPTNRDAAIWFFGDSVGTECTQEVVEKLGLSTEKCNQRHIESVEQCKVIAATDLPSKLSQVELGRAMLRFSLCHGMLIQGESFDLTVWEPTITAMLDRAHDSD